MTNGRNKKRIWTRKNVLIDAKKYETISEWAKNSSAYSVAKKHKWFKIATQHMNLIHGKWQDK
jgi:hypothetical protein